MTFAAVETLVRDRIGLDPASLGAETLPRAVEGRMNIRGLTSTDSYAGLLAADPSEWAALVAEVIVPETWFFRGGWTFFKTLARWVRDRSIARGPARPIRILSVPCSTGEEPYSLAIALDEEGIPPSVWTIEGVDLSDEQRTRAAVARYSAMSFRELDRDPRSRYFLPIEGGRWELIPRVREMVRIRTGNLIDPGFLAGGPTYDLVICRNLFIYLTHDARARAVDNLDRLLAADARLCVTPVEADQLPADKFVPDGPVSLSTYRRVTPADVVGPRSGLIHMRPRAGGQAATPDSVSRSSANAYLPPPASPADPELRQHRAPAVASNRADLNNRGCLVPDVVSNKLADPVRAGRELADGGRLDEARAVCDRAIGNAPTAQLFSLLGVIHLATGRAAAAAESFRKALYLDPDHREALTHMIVLCEQQGQLAQAAGLRRRLSLLEHGVSA